MFEIEIKKLRNRFEKVINKVDDGMIYIFAQFEVEKILEDAQAKYNFWHNTELISDEVLLPLIAIINEAKQYLEDLIDLIEIERTKYL